MTREGAEPPNLSTEHDFTGGVFLPLYVASVDVSGGDAAHGRSSGHARSEDGMLDVSLRLPTELGGQGGGTNPEQLFAAGYAACFHGALSLVASQARVDPASLSVNAKVAFGRDPADGGYLLDADLIVHWPGVDAEVAQTLIEKADALCPYSKMARQGTPARVRLAR